MKMWGGEHFAWRIVSQSENVVDTRKTCYAASCAIGIVIYEATGKIDDEKDQMSKPEIRKEVCFILQSSK